MSDRVAESCKAQPSVLLLTATIDVRSVAQTARRDPRLRLDDYKQALCQWLENPDTPPLIFCENSDYDLAELRQLCQDRNRHGKPIDLHSFEGQDFPPHLGKGYGEMGIIAHALAHSCLVGPATKVLKVTGRLYVRNIGRLMAGLQAAPDTEVFCDLRRGLTSSDSRVFCASVRFLRDYFLPLRDQANDSAGVYLEHLLARSVHRVMADGRRWSLLPVVPDIRGVSGSGNVEYRATLYHRMRRALFYGLKARILSH